MTKTSFSVLFVLSLCLSCKQAKVKCAQEAYDRYKETLFSGNSDEAFQYLRRAYHCDTLNADIAVQYADWTMKYGLYDTSIVVLMNAIRSAPSLLLYLDLQIALNKKDGLPAVANDSVIREGLISVKGNESDLWYFLPRAAAVYFVQSPDSAIAYLHRFRGLHTGSYEEESIREILLPMESKSFNLETYLFGDTLPLYSNHITNEDTLSLHSADSSAYIGNIQLWPHQNGWQGLHCLTGSHGSRIECCIDSVSIYVMEQGASLVGTFHSCYDDQEYSIKLMRSSRLMTLIFTNDDHPFLPDSTEFIEKEHY